MVKLINALTGSEMYVDESRLDEYLAKGHKIAPPPETPKQKRARKKAEQADN